MGRKQLTAPDIAAAKGARRLAVITAYDYPSGLMADQAGADIVLVGDSLAMVVMGLPDTLGVTLDEMLHHTRCTARGVGSALVVGDMPFLSYQQSVEQAVLSAGRFLKEAGARAVKLEGGLPMVPTVRALVRSGIPVMGHVGLTPQHIATIGGFKMQGKTAESAKALLDDALALCDAGCFSIVLEAVPAEAAALITEAVPVPTIGIGAGPHCDGQVLVLHDVLGLYDRQSPRFAKRYAELGKAGTDAVRRYCDEVRAGAYPDEAHSTRMPPEELKRLKDLLA